MQWITITQSTFRFRFDINFCLTSWFSRRNLNQTSYVFVHTLCKPRQWIAIVHLIVEAPGKATNEYVLVVNAFDIQCQYSTIRWPFLRKCLLFKFYLFCLVAINPQCVLKHRMVKLWRRCLLTSGAKPPLCGAPM